MSLLRALVVVALTACGGGSQGSGDASVADSGAVTLLPARAQVGPEGGRLGSVDGRFEVIIPEGALSTAIEIAVSADPRADEYQVEPENLTLARPLLVRIFAEPGALSSPRAARVGRARPGESFAALESIARSPGGRLTAWSWSGGRFRVVERACDPADGTYSCIDAPRERCILDPAMDGRDLCGVPCVSDAECPDAQYCASGRCSVRTCDSDADCPRDLDVCAGVREFRACVPVAAPRGCEACRERERCIHSRDDDGRVVREFCQDPSLGCRGEREGCLLRTHRAFDGLARTATAPPDAAWTQAGRFTYDRIVRAPFRSVRVATSTEGSLGPTLSRSTWMWTEDRYDYGIIALQDSGDPRRFRLLGPTSISEEYTLVLPPETVLMRATTAVRNAQLPRSASTVLSWRVPLSGRVRVDLEASLPPAAPAYATERAELRLVTISPGLDVQNPLGDSLLLTSVGEVKREVVEFEVQRTATIEVEAWPAPGGATVPPPVLVRWSNIYLSVRP